MDKEENSESPTERVMEERGTITEARADPLYEQEETSGEYEGQIEEDVHRAGEGGGEEMERLREEWERKRVEMERERVRAYGEETQQPYPYSPEYCHLKVRTQRW